MESIQQLKKSLSIVGNNIGLSEIPASLSHALWCWNPEESNEMPEFSQLWSRRSWPGVHPGRRITRAKSRVSRGKGRKTFQFTWDLSLYVPQLFRTTNLMEHCLTIWSQSGLKLGPTSILIWNSACRISSPMAWRWSRGCIHLRWCDKTPLVAHVVKGKTGRGESHEISSKSLSVRTLSDRFSSMKQNSLVSGMGFISPNPATRCDGVDIANTDVALSRE